MRKEREVLAKHIIETSRAIDHCKALFSRGLITESEVARETSRKSFVLTLYEGQFLDTYNDEEGFRPEFAQNLGTYEDNMDTEKRIRKAVKDWKKERIEREMQSETSLLNVVYGGEE